MTTAVNAEERVLKQLENLANSPGTHVGLIIGQVTSQRSYVIHVVPTPEQSREVSLTNIKDLDEVRMGEHGRYVTRMLPGGLHVLGVFVVSSEELFTTPNTAFIKKMLCAVDKSVSEGFSLLGRNPSDAYFVFHFNGSSKKYQVKSCDRNISGGLKNVDWKFQTTTSWCQIDTEYVINEKLLEISPNVTFLQQIENLHKKVANDVSTLAVNLNGKDWEPSTNLEKIQKLGDGAPLLARLLRPSKKEGTSEMVIAESVVQILLLGSLPSRVHLHPRTSAAEAATAVRQDIVRSLGARLEMHWDSLVDETEDSPEQERVHVPPRRVLLRPDGWTLQLSDFLFPGENSEQTIRTCKEILDVDVDMKNVECEFEQFPDGTVLLSESSAAESTIGEKPSDGALSIPILLIGAAALLVILAIFAQFFIISK